MRVQRMRPLQRLIHHKLPVPPTQLIPLDPAHLDSRPQLRHIHRQRKQPPLPHKRDLELGRNQRQQDTHSMRARQQMHDEKVVFPLPPPRTWRPNQQRHGRFLALLELRPRILDLPRVPVLQHLGLVVAEQGRDVVGAGLGEEVIEAFVVGDVFEDLEDGARGVGRGLGVGRVVEVLVQVVVEAGCVGERFDGDGAGGELEAVA